MSERVGLEENKYGSLRLHEKIAPDEPVAAVLKEVTLIEMTRIDKQILLVYWLS